jgi:spore coat polysaccharide biosynthesis protein SpsF
MQTKKKPHIAAVVQARMRSTRLPGKVLKPIVGQPLLWHILHRLRKSELIETLCVATTTDPADDALAAYAREQGAVVVRGPEDDVLARFALASHTIDPDIIVRVNADAPLVDAGFVDFLVREMMRAQADFVMLKPGLSAIHDGADPMSRWALDKLVLKAHDDPVAREHVSAYFKLHQDFVNIAHIDLPAKWQFKGARLSVDTPADVTFIEAVYERLHAQAGEATLTDLVALLNREPALLDLNAHVQQKAATAVAGTVIVRCDGGSALGLGHVRRCLSIARALRDREGFGVRFAMKDNALAMAPAQTAGFPVDVMPAGAKEVDWLLDLGQAHKPVAMLLDVRTDLSATSVMRLRGADMIVATIDDASSRRLSADASFYPPVPQAFALDWRGAEAEPHIGWEWVALGQDMSSLLSSKSGRPRVIVSMGGSDPHGLTIPAVKALSGIDVAFDATVVLGPGADHRLDKDVARIAPRFTVVRSPNDLPRLMAEADLGLISFGVTAYELAALGVPALYMCLTEDHAASASAFERAGMGVSLGVASTIGEAKIAIEVEDLLKDRERRRAMAAAGRLHLDGRGAQRIAAHLKRMVEERREALNIVGARPLALAV